MINEIFRKKMQNSLDIIKSYIDKWKESMEVTLQKINVKKLEN